MFETLVEQRILEAQARAMRKLQALALALAESRPGRQRGLFVEPRYCARIVSRLA